jgi:hypothetical protein
MKTTTGSESPPPVEPKMVASLLRSRIQVAPTGVIRRQIPARLSAWLSTSPVRVSAAMLRVKNGEQFVNGVWTSSDAWPFIAPWSGPAPMTGACSALFEKTVLRMRPRKPHWLCSVLFVRKDSNGLGRSSGLLFSWLASKEAEFKGAACIRIHWRTLMASAIVEELSWRRSPQPRRYSCPSIMIFMATIAIVTQTKSRPVESGEICFPKSGRSTNW